MTERLRPYQTRWSSAVDLAKKRPPLALVARAEQLLDGGLQPFAFEIVETEPEVFLYKATFKRIDLSMRAYRERFGTFRTRPDAREAVHPFGHTLVTWLWWTPRPVKD